jgi:Cu(I)-responsive transcriptional regulator
MEPSMNIGDVARQSGLSAKMIRHYEAIGLLPAAARTESGYRVFTPSDLHTLRFIQRARSLGFSLSEVMELVSLWQNRRRRSADVQRLAKRHVEALKTKIAELQSMVDTLQTLASTCHGDDRPQCPILDALVQKEEPHDC